MWAALCELELRGRASVVPVLRFDPAALAGPVRLRTLLRDDAFQAEAARRLEQRFAVVDARRSA
jgi:hypothetical protein